MKLKLPVKYASILDANPLGFSGRDLLIMLCANISAADFSKLLKDLSLHFGNSDRDRKPTASELSEMSLEKVEVDFPNEAEELLTTLQKQLGITKEDAASFMLARVGDTFSGAITANNVIGSGDFPLSARELSDITGIPQDNIPQDFDKGPTRSNSRKKKR